MGWWDDWGRRATTGVVTGGLSEAWNPDNYDGASGGWLSEHSGQPTSNIPGADRNNFQLAGADARGDFLRGGAQNAQSRSAPQAGESGFAEDQRSLVDRLRRQMNGEDSLSQLQLRDATDSNIAQQRSLAASATPGNAAMSQRLAAQQIGRTNQGFGAQAAQLGIQERNAAANALGAVAGQGRAQDQQNNQFNVGAQLQQRGMNDQYTQGMSGLELQNAQALQQGNMAYEQDQTNRRGQDLGIQPGPANWERVAGVAGAVAPLVAASDERLKTNISTPDGGHLDSLIERLKPHIYAYKDPSLGQGPRVGVMAQDVERGGPAGQALVSDVGGPGGPKVLDVPKSLGTALGLIGRLGERLDAVEGGGAVAARTKQTARPGRSGGATPRPAPPPEQAGGLVARLLARA